MVQRASREGASSTLMAKLLPYSSRVQERIASEGLRGRQVWCAIGGASWAWVKCRPGHLAVLLPPGAYPGQYKWSTVVPPNPALNPALLALAGRVTDEDLLEVAKEILLAGAHRVLAVADDGYLRRFVRQDARAA